MLCTVGHHDRPSWPFVSLYLIFLSLILVLSLLSIFHPVHAAPIPELVQEYENMLPENSSDNLTEIAANTDVYFRFFILSFNTDFGKKKTNTNRKIYNENMLLYIIRIVHCCK